MDLNIDNYSIDELFNLFNIDDKNNDPETIQQFLSNSISIITNEDSNSLPEDKTNLIEFYTKSAFKILNNNNNNNNIKKNNQNKEIIKNEILANELSINNGLLNDNGIINDNSPIIKKDLIYGGLKQPFPEKYSFNTNNNKFVEGNVNPILRETIVSIFSINSKFRDNYSKSTTDFSVELNEPYNNVVSIKLASMELINSYYTVSQYLRTNRFNVEFFQYNQLTNDISNNSRFLEDFTIPDGNYSTTTIVDAINNLMYDISTSYYRLIQANYDDIKGKINFYLFDASGNPPATGYNWGFNLNFADNITPNRPAFLNLGWLLGYRNLTYTFFKQPPPNPTPCDQDFYDYKYKSPCLDGYLPYYQTISTNILNIGINPEAVTNLIGTHYFLLEVDDFNKNQSEVFKSNTELKYNYKSTFNYSVFNVLARIPNVADQFSVIFEDSSDRVFKNRRYFGPVRISKLKIRLLDENGVVVNLNNNDIIINLEIETLNSSYKNQTYTR